MTDRVRNKRILVIDRQDHWRDIAVRTLRERGFVVQDLSSYDYPSSDEQAEDFSPDLIVLGCACVGQDELEVIKRILDRKQRLLVFSTTLPWLTMRSLFLAGAKDVTDRTYDPTHLVTTVTQALKNRSERKRSTVSRKAGDI